MITITYIPTKFEDVKVRHEVEFNPENPFMAFYISSAADVLVDYKHQILQERVEVSVNKNLLTVDDWDFYELKDSDEVVITPALGGGGGFLRALIGVVLIAIGIALSITPAGVFAATAFTAGIMMLGASLVLGALFQALFPVSTPTYGDQGSDSPTYSWEGAQTTSIVDRPIGVVYGEFVAGGNVITAFVTSDGAKNYLNMLIGLSEGEIEGILKIHNEDGVCTSIYDVPDIVINAQPITSYQGVTWDYRLGTNNQTSIPGFDKTHTYFTDVRKVIPAGTTYTTEGENLNEFRVQLQCPQLFALDGEGNPVNNTVVYRIYYRINTPQDSNPWTLFSPLTTYVNPSWTAWKANQRASIGDYDASYNCWWAPTGTGERTPWYIVENWFNRNPEPPYYVTNPIPDLTISGASKSAVRVSTTVPNLPDGRYDIKVVRMSAEQTDFRTGSDLYLEGFDEITYHDLSYPNTALLSLKILATDQLSGGLPNILVKIRGRKVRVPKVTCRGNLQIYNKCYWDSDQSCYIAPTSYSGDNTCVVDTTVANWPLQWTQDPVWCLVDFLTNKRFGLGDYITDSIVNWTDALVAAKYADMMVDDLSGLGITEKRFLCDGVWDTSEDGFKAIIEFCKIFRAWAIWSEGTIKFIVDKAGSPVQLFNMSNIVAGSFSTAFASITSIPNLIEIQFADKNNDYKTTMREIVDQVAWTAGDPRNKYSINFKGITRQSQAVREGKFFLNSAKYRQQGITFKGTLDSVHCQAGDIISFQHDVPLWAYGGRVVTASKAGNKIILDTIVPCSASPSKLFWQSNRNAFVTATVTNTAASRILTLSPSLTSTTVPVVEGVWSWGLAGAQKKDFKILNISRAENNEVDVGALEYNESVYSDTGIVIPITDISMLPDPYAVPGPVTDLALSERPDRPAFDICFNIPRDDLAFSYAEVQLSLNGTSYWTYTTTRDASADILVEGLPSQTYYVRVYSCNNHQGKNLSTAPTDQITLSASSYPRDPEGLTISGQENATIFDGLDCKFEWKRATIDVMFATVLDYKLQILVSGSIVREEFVTDTSYVYTYGKNFGDNGGTPTSTYTIRIWARSVGRVLSKKSISLEVSNTSPSAVTNLVAHSLVGGVRFSWDKNLEEDLLCYYCRSTVATVVVDSWRDTIDNQIVRMLTATEITSYTSKARISFEVQTKDAYYQYSSTATAVRKAGQISDSLFQILALSSGGTIGAVSSLYDNVLATSGVTIT